MTERANRRAPKIRIGSLLRVLLPSIATLILIVLLLLTMFFTDFDWQWVTFLGGILFASVLSLVSATWKSSWRMARRTAEAAHFKQRLAAETQQHRSDREQLERELALHQQDRTRLARETEGHKLAAQGKLAAESMIAFLAQHLEENACYVDRSRRILFHTRAFAAWSGASQQHIDGYALEDALLPRNAELLRPHLLEALDGRAASAELALMNKDRSERRVAVSCLPRHDAAGEVEGMLLLLRETRSAQLALADSEDTTAEETRVTAEILVSDEGGNAIYLSSLTEELSGWSDPRERILHAIRNDGFDLYAQDIVALAADAQPRIMQELLIRMRDEEQNMIPPGTFLPVAERFNMMPAIDRFVVKKALAACAAANPGKTAAVMPALCVNLARATLEDPAFPDFVASALAQSGIDGKVLCFEIADKDAIACLAEAKRLAHALKPLGCRFSLDGFGRAGIGFDHVKALPLNYLKIDGSIVLQILRVPEALSKVRAMQRVSKVIGLQTIAEMVESDDCLARLQLVGVDYAQGFGIAEPRLYSQGTG